MEESGNRAFCQREPPTAENGPLDAGQESTGKEQEADKQTARLEKGQEADSQAAHLEKGQEDRKHSETRREQSTKQLLFGFLTELLLIVFALWAALNFVVCVRIHYGNNMYPSIRDGDLVVTFRPQPPFLNAAVLYEQEGKLRLGRVVGMPGHVIDISEEGALTVNGFAPAEEVFYPTFPSENGEIAYPYTVEEGQVFILNDFRLDTTDSRIFGGIDLQDVKGTMLLSMRRRGF